MSEPQWKMLGLHPWKRRYIGVTGIMTREEMEELCDAYAPPKGITVHQLILGVLVDSKTASGATNRHPKRCPKIEKVRDLMRGPRKGMGDGLLSFNAIRYSTQEPRTLGLQLAGLLAYDPNVIQLDADWPGVGSFKAIHAAPHYRGHESESVWRYRIILRIGPKAMEMAERDPKKIAARVGAYRRAVASGNDLVSDVLLDASGGRGQPLDVDFALACLRAIRDARIDFGVGVAGGLDAKSIPRLEPIAREFPYVSVSAESRLRDAGDHLDLNKARAYIKAAQELFASVR